MQRNTFLLATLLCAAAIPAQAMSHYWVDAANGSDQNPGTRAQPFRSLTHAVGYQTANVHVHVLPGVYAPSTTGDFWDSVTSAPKQLRLDSLQNFKITGVDKMACIFDFEYGDGLWGVVNITGASTDIEISDLTMRNAGPTPWANGAIVINNSAVTNVDIHNCYFEQTYSTLIVWRGFDVAFHDNVIVDVVPNTYQWPSVGIRIRTGYYGAGTGDNTYIYNNTFHKLDQGIDWDGNQPVAQWIVNNVFLECSKGLVDSAYPGPHVVVENNLAYGCTTWNYDPVIGPNGTAPVLSATNLEVDPMLANPVAGDFSPLPGSPCIEAGSTLTHPFMMNDYEGNNRAVDSDENGIAVPDIGALEDTDISMAVSNFAQGQTAIFDIQTSNPTSWAFGALLISFTKAPAYNPWWGMSGPNMFGLLGTMVGFPGMQMQLQLPADPALDGMWIHTQFAGLKVTGTATVIKGTGLSSSML